MEGNAGSLAAPENSRTGIAVYAKRRNAEILIAVDDSAERRGLTPGLALAQARAMHLDLVAEPEDAQADAQLLARIADWCARYTPLVAIDAPDGLLLDIGGCAHLFGGEAALIKDLVARLTGFGFAVRAAIADTIGAAWAVAHFATQRIVASGTERALLAPLALAALRLPGDTVAVLKRVGLKRIGDIAELPRGPLAARFGGELLRQLDRALGREPEPLSPLQPVPSYLAERRFAEPIAREEDVLAATERLARQLCAMLERRGEGARHVELRLFRTDGAVRSLMAGTSRPIRDPLAIRKLFVERLAALGDELDPGFGFDLARLSVLTAEPSSPTQVSLGQAENAADLDGLVDRLAARLGARRVGRMMAQDSHIPELAAMTVPAQAHADRDGAGWAAFRAFREAAELGPRPLRLLAKPEPIIITPMIVDAPPLRFQWRRAWHDVVAAEGPERIEAEWWAEDGDRARDYFRVDDRNGHRFWLFRAGLYRDARAPLWFMHGLFV
jgi:protein ImuB